MGREWLPLLRQSCGFGPRGASDREFSRFAIDILTEPCQLACIKIAMGKGFRIPRQGAQPRNLEIEEADHEEWCHALCPD